MWERYYHETDARGLHEQAPYYLYVLEKLAAFIRKGVPPEERLNTLLGGIHPLATQPRHFIDLCAAAFPDQQLNPIIIDQNQQALDGLSGTGYTPIKAQLEKLPADIANLHLVICDYTLDFMDDDQIILLNQTLPAKLNPFGIFIVTFDAPLFPDRQRRLNWARYEIRVEFRPAGRVQALLSNLKMIFLANTGNSNQLAVFTQTNFPFACHQGAPVGLYGQHEQGPFAAWLKNYSTGK